MRLITKAIRRSRAAERSAAFVLTVGGGANGDQAEGTAAGVPAKGAEGAAASPGIAEPHRGHCVVPIGEGCPQAGQKTVAMSRRNASGYKNPEGAIDTTGGSAPMSKRVAPPGRAALRERGGIPGAGPYVERRLIWMSANRTFGVVAVSVIWISQAPGLLKHQAGAPW